MEVNTVGQKQDGGRTLPDRFEPPRLSARVQKRDSVAVLGETGDPVTHLVPIERGIEIDEELARPQTIQAVCGPIDLRNPKDAGRRRTDPT